MEFLKDPNRTPNPLKNANLLSQFFFWYMNKTFSLGSSRPLEKGDVHDITDKESSELLSEELERNWLVEKTAKKNPSLFFCLLKMRGCILLLCGFMLFITELLKICQTVFLQQLIQNFSDSDFGKDNSAYFWAVSLSACLIACWALLHHSFHVVEKTGTRLKIACIGVIYKKVLRLSNHSLARITSGHIVTLISSDVHKVQEGFNFLCYLWISPILLAIGVVILWREIGPSCLAGIGVLIITIPIQIWFGKFFAYMRSKTVAKTDQRVNIMNEVITSMQVTKMYTWEDSFAEMVNKVRCDESNRILKTAMARSLNNTMFSVSPYLVSLATFSLFYVYGSGITLAKVFLVLNIFFTIRLSVVLFFPMEILMLTESYVSCKRIQAFLLENEQAQIKSSTAGQTYPEAPLKTEALMHFENVTAAWNNDLEDVICDLSFKADLKNCLVMIVGTVGTGKSSILMAAMNELYVKKGNIIKNGSLGYAAQQAWIFSGTLRSNVLFGQEFDKKRYEKTITACALKQDLESFAKGDLTLVGERGVSLSGGQKARISLARAVYSNADIYLLDDPLSAVDAKVGKYIFEKCIRGLLRNKVVILATHQIQYLQHATNIVCLKEDSSTVASSVHELSEKGVNLVSILDSESQEKRQNHDAAIEAEDEHMGGQNDTLSGITLDIGEKNKRLHGSIQSLNSFHSNYEKEEETEEEENRNRGAIPAKLYLEYFIQGVGWISTLALLLSLVASQVMLTFTDYYLAEWASGEEQRNGNVTITAKFYVNSDPDINVYVLASLVVACFLINFFRTTYFYATLVKCSRELHNLMFKAVLKAPIYFFDTNPVGQILNRFSRDVYFMDDELPWTFFDFASLSLLTLAIIILNCVSVPYLTVLVIPLMIIFFYARRYYMKSSRELRRLEAVSRSPLYTHISATLAGITTVRSFDIQEKILHEFYACQDYQTGAWFMFLSGSRWFSQRLDLLTVVFSICSTFAPIVAAPYIDIDAGLAAVSLSYILMLCGMFQWCVRQSAEVDNLMTSVERVFEYTKLEPEPDNGASKDLRETWPEYGLISGEGASFAYHSSLPYVLKNLYFCIQPMEKVGIVGRTGAGKSSFLSMLFRMGNITGTVQIDGYPISGLKLKDLRKSISIIPQDPVMFSGSLRKNLDPFNEYTDADVWEAIEEVQLKDSVMELPGRLQSEITEAGSNLSVGERQLLCLARALLKKNKIIVIDEATANVDMETDALIQQTIREKFKECTVLTVAHRLNTVMDSDRVMVMEDGSVIEFDEPYQLLQDSTGSFRKLVDQAGSHEAKRLETLAKKANQLRCRSESRQHNDTYPRSYTERENEQQTQNWEISFSERSA
ncbi:ATP-binding cassette sub-family C member 4-like [Hydractinia symbiolongicarpus]|uniref:ATP-binding cassette sub-family C member 4-like n=1 Tax=Hydractinia symbiolongicarpus TaxID=13093 RepID=UPI002550D9C9|nr:ATP-binding cassette sub-family C member 4-like [Hydractinia symbiolongicarpus]XP_057310388.1 ATP-binding cassette sub-family C member 4-like [Hydractinia symbiolongicarpus]XP_057310389.1 ATP-binding cassette sub-family C member 4-like [Hydractinia symbiolongicarpus]